MGQQGLAGFGTRSPQSRPCQQEQEVMIQVRGGLRLKWVANERASYNDHTCTVHGEVEVFCGDPMNEYDDPHGSLTN